MRTEQKGGCNWTGLVLGFSVLALGLGIWYGLKMVPPAPVPEIRSATVLPDPRPLQPFQLTDSRRQPFSPEALEGRWTLLSFGYTHCPDICPSTLALLDYATRNIESADLEEKLQVVFVSIDPERDTLERLAEYVAYFNPSFLGATGEPAALHALTDQLGVLFMRVDETDSALGYVMDHSTQLVLVDPEARMHALFSSPHDPERIAVDTKNILVAYRRTSNN